MSSLLTKGEKFVLEAFQLPSEVISREDAAARGEEIVRENELIVIMRERLLAWLKEAEELLTLAKVTKFEAEQLHPLGCYKVSFSFLKGSRLEFQFQTMDGTLSFPGRASERIEPVFRMMENIPDFNQQLRESLALPNGLRISLEEAKASLASEQGTANHAQKGTGDVERSQLG